MLTPHFEEVCRAFTDDGGLNDQMQLRLLDECFDMDEEAGGWVLNLTKVKDLMVYLCIYNGVYIGAVRPEIRLESPGFAIGVGAEQYRRRKVLAPVKAVAA